MAFNDTFRLSAHAVITNAVGDVLMLKATYGEMRWGLPGGALEPGETIHAAVARECMEELGCAVEIGPLTGVYYHGAYGSQAFIFRCALADAAHIALSDEHSEWRFVPRAELSPVQRRRVEECLAYDGIVRSAAF